MQYQNILTVALIIVVLLPVATAHTPTPNSESVSVQDESATPLVNGKQTTSTVASAKEGSNYTRLYIEEEYRHNEVKPGESTTFNVTIGNSEDHTVTLNPHVVLPKIEGRPIEKSWITIETDDTTLQPDQERTFTVTVSVPADAELGEYRALVAFTNETISYEKGQPPRPVHAATLNVNVFKEPTVKIRSERYFDTQIRAGNSYTYEIVVENTGDQTVPLNPKLKTEESRERYGENENTVQRSWFEIDAPSEVGAGETATVSVTVTPPASASVGDYHANLNLGLKDPARPEREGHWQEIDLGFQVWKQPDQPYETSFQVSDAAENVKLTLSADQDREMANTKPATFEVSFVGPNGTVVNHQRVEVSNGGYVSLGQDERRGQTRGPYTSGNGDKQFVYRITDPAAGQWTVKIMPHNTTNFRYEIIRSES